MSLPNKECGVIRGKKYDKDKGQVHFRLVVNILCAAGDLFQLFCRRKGPSKGPEGYSWKWCESVQAGFLLPDGWFFKEEESEGTRAFFLTKESIEQEGKFKTGFSINVIRDASKKTGLTPSLYAQQFIDKMKASLDSTEVSTVGDGVYFKGVGGFFRSESPELGTIVQYSGALGNDKTGTLYLYTFESPEREWNDAWKLGSVIVYNLALETEF